MLHIKHKLWPTEVEMGISSTAKSTPRPLHQPCFIFFFTGFSLFCWILKREIGNKLCVNVSFGSFSFGVDFFLFLKFFYFLKKAFRRVMRTVLILGQEEKLWGSVCKVKSAEPAGVKGPTQICRARSVCTGWLCCRPLRSSTLPFLPLYFVKEQVWYKTNLLTTERFGWKPSSQFHGFVFCAVESWEDTGSM